MLNVEEASKVVLDFIPGGKIQTYVEYKDLYVFLVHNNNVGEEFMDPFYSVNKLSGELSDFSILTDGDGDDVVSLFVSKQKGF